MRNRALPEESLERVESLLEELRFESRKIPIIVEGKRDRKALRDMGVDGKIILVNTGKSLSDLADFIAERYDSVIILTDWDRKGSYLAGRLFTLLSDNGVSCNMEYRRKLGFYLGSHISSVEEISNIMAKNLYH